MAIDSPVAGKLHFCVTAIIMYSGYNCNGNVVTCQWAIRVTIFHMDYEFLGGNLALDFTNTLHSHGESDPGEDLKSVADLVEWATQAGLLRDMEIHKLGRVHADQVRFQRALALRELLYEIFSLTARGKKPTPRALRNFQSFYQDAIRRAEFRPVANHYRLMWPAATHPLERISQEIARSAADLLTSEAFTRVRQCSGEELFLVVCRQQPQRDATLVRYEGVRQPRQSPTLSP
jgi:predicted RNA-binding Zn ribbon-like protein